MAKSLAQVQEQIDRLQKIAQALRAKEAVGVIVQVKALIAQYELTPADLGFAALPSSQPMQAVKPAKKTRATATRIAKAVKISNAATAASALAIAPAATAPQAAAKPAKGKKSAKGAKASKPQVAVSAPAAAPKSARKTKAAAKVLGPIKYRDAVGNEWTGRGTRPKWYLAALAAGQTAEQLLVQPKG